ncbi:MAG: hypothetical protein V2I33_21255 [Kangiellaceae bacterium]|jgi:hypothetical protein|nr:hypothetical protein [Kangiellaceae bacterium]
MTHLEALKTAAIIVFQYLGWLTAIVVTYFWWGQRKEIKGLKETIRVLKSHDQRREEKDKLRDEILTEMVKVIRDQNLADERKKKIDELFSDLLKPWADEDENQEL